MPRLWALFTRGGTLDAHVVARAIADHLFNPLNPDSVVDALIESGDFRALENLLEDALFEPPDDERDTIRQRLTQARAKTRWSLDRWLRRLEKRAMRAGIGDLVGQVRASILAAVVESRAEGTAGCERVEQQVETRIEAARADLMALQAEHAPAETGDDTHERWLALCSRWLDDGELIRARQLIVDGPEGLGARDRFWPTFAVHRFSVESPDVIAEYLLDRAPAPPRIRPHRLREGDTVGRELLAALIPFSKPQTDYGRSEVMALSVALARCLCASDPRSANAPGDVVLEDHPERRMYAARLPGMPHWALPGFGRDGVLSILIPYATEPDEGEDDVDEFDSAVGARSMDPIDDEDRSEPGPPKTGLSVVIAPPSRDWGPPRAIRLDWPRLLGLVASRERRDLALRQLIASRIPLSVLADSFESAAARPHDRLSSYDSMYDYMSGIMMAHGLALAPVRLMDHLVFATVGHPSLALYLLAYLMRAATESQRPPGRRRVLTEADVERALWPVEPTEISFPEQARRILLAPLKGFPIARACLDTMTFFYRHGEAVVEDGELIDYVEAESDEDPRAIAHELGRLLDDGLLEREGDGRVRLAMGVGDLLMDGKANPALTTEDNT